MRAVHKYPKGMRLKVVSYLPIQLSALFCGEFGKIPTQPILHYAFSSWIEKQ